MIDSNTLGSGPQFRQVNSTQQTAPIAPQRVQHPQQSGLTNVPFDLHKTFFFKHVSTLDGQTYEGQFTYKKLSLNALTQIGVRTTQRNGGYHYDENQPGCGVDRQTDFLNKMLAHFEYSIIQAPSWFNIDQLYDLDLVGKLYEIVVDMENSFFRSQGAQVQSGGSSQDGSSPTGQESRAAGHITSMGRGQIPDSMEP